MDRLTIPDEPIEGGMRRSVVDARAVKEQAMGIYWRLKAYEDTGLTPEEIVDALALTDWIRVDERLPKREEWMGADDKQHYLRRLEVVVASDTLEYFFVFYDGHKWFDKFGRTYGNVIAWKIHEPFNPLN